MENQNLQQSVLEAHAKALNITTTHLSNKTHALKSINTTVYHSKLEIQKLNYACNFILTLADTEHRINQLCNGLRKLEADVATIYNYINTLEVKLLHQCLSTPYWPKNNTSNIQAVISSCLSLPNYPNTNIWSLYEFLEIQPLNYNETLIISFTVPLVDSTFHIQSYCIHTIPMVNKALCKTFKTELKITYLVITDNEKYYTHPIDMDIMKCLISKGHYCSLSGGLYPILNHTDCTIPLYFKNDIQIKSFCPISVNNLASNIIIQLNPNQYLLGVI